MCEREGERGRERERGCRRKGERGFLLGVGGRDEHTKQNKWKKDELKGERREEADSGGEEKEGEEKEGGGGGGGGGAVTRCR